MFSYQVQGLQTFIGAKTSGSLRSKMSIDSKGSNSPKINFKEKSEGLKPVVGTD